MAQRFILVPHGMMAMIAAFFRNSGQGRQLLRRTYNWARSKRIDLMVFVAMAGLYFFINFQRIGVPGTVFNEMQSEFDATASQVTALAAIFLYVYAGMQFFVGAGADHFGPARVVLTGGALLTAGSIAFPYCQTLPQVYAVRVIVALGASVMYISIIKQLTLTFEPRHFPPLLGLLLVIGYSGGVVAYATIPAAVTAWGWRTSFRIVALLCGVVFVIVLALVARTGAARGRRTPFSFRVAAEVARTKAIRPILLAGSINFGIYYVLQMTLGKKFLEDFLGMSSSAAGHVNGAMLATVTVGYLAGGFLPKLTGERRRPFVIIASAGTLAAAAMLFAGVKANLPAWWFVAAYILLGATNSPAIVGTSLLKELCPPAAAAFGISLLNAGCYIAVALASSAAGIILDAWKEGARKSGNYLIYPPGAYAAIFACMIGLAVVATAASFYCPETRGAQKE